MLTVRQKSAQNVNFCKLYKCKIGLGKIADVPKDYFL